MNLFRDLEHSTMTTTLAAQFCSFKKFKLRQQTATPPSSLGHHSQKMNPHATDDHR
jgi:hypothetical protein